LIFKLNKSALDKLTTEIIKDLGPKLRDEMRDEYEGLKTYYPKSGRSKKIVWDSTAKVVGADDFGIAASDSGGEWRWPGKMPNIGEIMAWLIRDGNNQGYDYSSEDVNKPSSKLKRHAYNVAKRIQDRGLRDDGNYWMDLTLLDYVQQYGANGSGMV
jgi:hypothetical protein